MKPDFLHAFEFFAGVPDSQLRPLCDYLMKNYGTDPRHHVIAANEGNAVGLAAGYHLATGKVPVVYLQNSGLGNIINPVASLLNDRVYGIPCFFIVGWRGEPGVHDEPQHVFQGEVTLTLLADMAITAHVLEKTTKEEELAVWLCEFRALWAQGKQTALVVRKGALTFEDQVTYRNDNVLNREEVIRHIAAAAGTGVIVSTTGKASRELFEIREKEDGFHGRDFLTVGSMGHSSSIALEIALQKPDTKVWIIDGDGALLMHMGSLALLGANAPENIVHVVINNGAHETVGGMPTVAERVDLAGIARSCGYPDAVRVDSYEALDEALHRAAQNKHLSFIEVRCALGARADLGRPTTSARENKDAFMSYLAK